MAGHGVHVIVVGNEKGGSGKSTTAFHLAIYLLYQGYKVASIDVDSRQQTLTHYVRNRRAWAKNRALHLTRLAHSLADTLITPVNDSLIDLNVMAQIDPVTGEPREMSHYARLAQRARSERLAIDGRTIDWVLLRNRISMLSSRNMRQVQTMLERIALRLGCRVADGIAERVIFRSLFASGLTVFDPLDEEMLGGMPSSSHLSARQEYRNLVEALHLPASEKAQARQALAASLSPQQEAEQRFVHMMDSEI